MTSMGVCPVHTVLTLLFITALKADEEHKKGQVTFWKEYFTMTCPDQGTLYNKNGDKLANDTTPFEAKYNNDMKGLYHCKIGDEKKYYFYVQGKVCPNCFELDATFLALAIIVDLLLTASLMVIIYRYTKKKTSDKLSHTSTGRRQPTESPEYEQLSAHTLSQGTYSVVNRMG